MSPMVHPSSRARKARGYARGPTGAPVHRLLSQVSWGPVKKSKEFRERVPPRPRVRFCEAGASRSAVSGVKHPAVPFSSSGATSEAWTSESIDRWRWVLRDCVIVRLAVNMRDNLVFTFSLGQGK